MFYFVCLRAEINGYFDDYEIYTVVTFAGGFFYGYY